MGAQGSSNAQGDHNNKNSRQNDRVKRVYSRICGNSQVLSTKQLTDFFPVYGHPLVKALFCTGTEPQPESTVSQHHFSYVLDKILAPRSASSLSQLYFEAFCGSESLKEKDVERLVLTALHLFLASCEISLDGATAPDQDGVRLLVQTILTKGTSGAGLNWLETNSPELLMGMHHWFVAQVSISDEVDSKKASEYYLPDHEGALLSVSMWWVLTSSLPSVYTQPKTGSSSPSSGATSQAQAAHKQPWTLLYSSRENGLSVNRLQHHIFGYRGPTVLIVSIEGGFIYAIALDTEWREGTLPWGGPNSVAIRLAPDYTVVEEGNNMVLFNDKSRNLPKGLFIGRDPKRRLLALTEGLQQVTHRGLTCHVINAEVWGCASSDVKLAQTKQKKTELQDAARAAKVKLPGQWDDNPDRLLLGWGTARTDYADGYREDRKQTENQTTDH